MFNIYKVEKELRIKEAEILKQMHDNDPEHILKKKGEYFLSMIF
jgi:hypothetical protein